MYVNGEKITTTPNHPFYVPAKGWTDAAKLRAGDMLVLLNGEYVVLDRVQHEILESPIAVYNFQVEYDHTYYVGESGIRVHNANCGGLKGSDATNAAKKLGYKPTNYRSHGQKVFYNPKTKMYITPNVDGHNGGVWKMAKTVKDLAHRKTRQGTYDEFLNWIGK